MKDVTARLDIEPGSAGDFEATSPNPDEEIRRNLELHKANAPYDGLLLLEAVRENLHRPGAMSEELATFMYIRLTSLLDKLDQGPLKAGDWFEIFRVSPPAKRGNSPKSVREAQRDAWIAGQYSALRANGKTEEEAFALVESQYHIGKKKLEGLVTQLGLAVKARGGNKRKR